MVKYTLEKEVDKMIKLVACDLDGTLLDGTHSIPKENAEAIVAKLREGKYSTEAAIIGEVTEEMPGRVVVTTEIGAETLLPPPGGELLPRIC